MEVDEEIVLQYVRTGNFEELHSSFWHARARKFHTEIFLFFFIRAMLPIDLQKLKCGGHLEDHQVFPALPAD
jgi:hypothetical protein